MGASPFPTTPTTLGKVSLLARQRGDQQRLDGVHAVLGLVEDDGGAGLEDLVGDLQAIQTTRRTP